MGKGVAAEREARSRDGSSPRGGRREASQRRRRRILAAARECFGERGFAGATVESIAARAGVSNGLLYQFFRNKEHLFEVVAEELIRDWIRAMVPGETAENSAGDALEGMFRRSVDFCRTHPLLPALFTRDQVLQLQRFRDVGARHVDAHRRHVASLLRRGIARGELRGDLDVPAVADVVCQLQVDYSTRAYRRDPHHPDDPRIVDAAILLLRNALENDGGRS